jgi:hypothetical protein
MSALSVLLAVALTVFICCSGVGEDQTINWSSFSVEELMDPGESVALIRNIQFNQYWDVTKASYRTGVLGERMKQTHPQFVSEVDKKVTIAGKMRTAKTFVLDSSLLSMHSLVAMQALVASEQLYRGKINVFDTTSGTESEARRLVSADNFTSLPEQAAHKSYLQHRKSALTSSIQLQSQRTKSRLDRVALRTVQKMEVVEREHAELLAYMGHHHEKLNSTNVEKYRELQALTERIESSRLEFEVATLKTQHEAAVDQVRRSVTLALETIKFRSSEELALLHQLQDFDASLATDTKLKLIQAETREFMDAIFNEVYALTSFVHDPWRALSLLRYFLLGATLILVLFECFQLALAAMRRLSTKSFVATVSRSTSHSRSWTLFRWGRPEQQASLLDGVLLSAESRAQLCGIIDAMRVAAAQTLPLPNVLIVGPSGSGKSIISRLIIDSRVVGSEVGNMIVCGGDLQAMGDGATVFLNGVIRNCCQQRSRLILVLEEADGVVSARGPPTSTDGVGEGAASAKAASNNNNNNNCIFSLLAGLRENSAWISLVIVSRVAAVNIDSALLDRIDLSLHLARPNELQRVEYVLRGVQDSLLAFLSAEEAEEAEALAGHAPADALRNICTVDLKEVFGGGAGRTDQGAGASTSPETDRPAATAVEPAAASSPAVGAAFISEHLHSFSSDVFELRLCLRLLLLLSGGWSFRDLNQFLAAVKYAVQCNESCRLTTNGWMKELMYVFEK